MKYYDFLLIEDTNERKLEIQKEYKDLKGFLFIPIQGKIIDKDNKELLTPQIIPINKVFHAGIEVNYKYNEDYFLLAIIENDVKYNVLTTTPFHHIHFYMLESLDNTCIFEYDKQQYKINIDEIVAKKEIETPEEPKYRFYIQSFIDEPMGIYDFKIGEVGDFSIYDNGNFKKSDYCLFQGKVFNIKENGIRPGTNLQITDSTHFNNKRISVNLIDLANAAEKERIKYRKAINNLPMKLLINDGLPVHAAKFKILIKKAENMLLHSMSNEELKYQIKDLMDKLFDDDRVTEKNDVNILISLIAEYFDFDKDTKLKDFSDRLKIMNTLEWRD